MNPIDRTMDISQAILDQRQVISEIVIKQEYACRPGYWESFGEIGYKKGLEDINYHLSYLAEAIAAKDPSLFTDYLAWAKVLFKSFNFPSDVLSKTLRHLQVALKQTLPEEMHASVDAYLSAGERHIQDAPEVLPSFLTEDTPLGGLAQKYLQALLQGERHRASKLILDAVDAGARVKDIYLQVFQPCQREIGRLWQMNLINVAQEHYCSASTQLIMSQLYPYIFATEKMGKKLIATFVGGELHEIGIRMVSDFFEMEGWDTYYLGANTPLESVLKIIVDQKPELICLSATMTFHVGQVAQKIARIRELENDQKRLAIMVGGYPFNVAPGLWKKVGADAWAGDAQEAVEVANRLLPN
jgi:methanogenic corrinoid protein MtbC1